MVQQLSVKPPCKLQTGWRWGFLTRTENIAGEKATSVGELVAFRGPRYEASYAAPNLDVTKMKLLDYRSADWACSHIRAAGGTATTTEPEDSGSQVLPRLLDDEDVFEAEEDDGEESQEESHGDHTGRTLRQTTRHGQQQNSEEGFTVNNNLGRKVGEDLTTSSEKYPIVMPVVHALIDKMAAQQFPSITFT